MFYNIKMRYICIVFFIVLDLRLIEKRVVRARTIRFLLSFNLLKKIEAQ